MNSAEDHPDPPLIALTGDTYPVRTQLRALGAIWDSTQRVWKIAPQKAAQAQALVDHRPKEALAPPMQESIPDELLADLPDPFEEAAQAPPMVSLTGNTYPVKDALKALGARWDSEQRAWLIRADKAEHARAIIASQSARAETAKTRSE